METTPPPQYVYLDIETDGLSPFENSISVIGLLCEGKVTQLQAPFDFAWTTDLLRTAQRTLVTFNGSAFDLRFIKAKKLLPPVPFEHVDLYRLSRSLGHNLGQKVWEKILGYERPKLIADITGQRAVELWQAHVHGDPKALSQLLRYNKADLEFLPILHNYLSLRLADRFGHLVVPQAPLSTQDLGGTSWDPFADEKAS